MIKKKLKAIKIKKIEQRLSAKETTNTNLLEVSVAQPKRWLVSNS